MTDPTPEDELEKTIHVIILRLEEIASSEQLKEAIEAALAELNRPQETPETPKPPPEAE
jgi:hypothetical protein